MGTTTQRRHSAEDRSFLQRRIALFGRTLFLLMLGISVVGVTVSALVMPDFMRRMPARPYYAVAIVALGALWLMCSRGAYSRRTLIALDAATTIAAGCALSTIVLQAPVEVPPGVPTTLFLTYLLAARAIVVPSDYRHTFVVSALAALPSIVVIWTFGETHAAARLVTVILPVWCALAVLLATWTSHVVYRLRRSVREAQQLGQYTLETKIGEGGMGVVYRARHALLRRPTVIKLLPPEKAGQHNLTRFEREVQLTSQLASPNTVAVYDFGRTDDGIFYYAMEHLDGIDLEQLVVEHGAQPAARVIHVLAQVCSALVEAHEAGLIHRDVKPSNVMLCRHGGALDVVKVLDFGLVKDISAGSDATLTHADAVLGTPLYVSPEAISAPEQVGGRSDLYAVGALGYHLLTGRAVFDGRTVAEVYARHLYAQPVPPSEHLASVPADLEALLLSCLAKAPDDRPRDARALRAALLACRDAGAWSDRQAETFWRDRKPTHSVRPTDLATLAVADTRRAETV
jgi:serine/threonine-protein kinase